MPVVVCQICQEEFYVKNWYLKAGWGRYCSVNCRNKSQLRGIMVRCKACKKEVYKSPSKFSHSKSGNFFCNKSCQARWNNTFRLEEKHPNWNGGNHMYRKILRRNGIIPSCYCCKLKDERVLVAHHIDHNRKNNNRSNLIWLCRNCHHLVHSIKNFEDELKKSLYLHQDWGKHSELLHGDRCLVV